MHLLVNFCFWSFWYSLLKLGQPYLRHFLYGHIICICLVSFAYFLRLLLHHARCFGWRKRLILPDLFLSMYHTRRMFSLLSKTWRIDFSSLFYKFFIYFGIALYCIAFLLIALYQLWLFSYAHWDIVTNVKYRSIDMLDPSMEL